MTKKKTTTTKPPAFKNTDIMGRRVDQEEFERFITRVNDLGLTSRDLKKRVRELCEEIAESVNGEDYGGGLEEQARFLLKEDGDWEESLRLIAQLKRPPAPARARKEPADSTKKRRAAPAKNGKKS